MLIYLWVFEVKIWGWCSSSSSNSSTKSWCFSFLLYSVSNKLLDEINLLTFGFF